ncbi:uncharacterized protein LOC128207351 [Mya arenaria]|uniref:uncharacterized protein LOC128207351 n=1 Tax=Mya arenaria TaxID=6604 RepID=UPI0022E0E82D|nr:uncharacterized protein LOC128207351 [Mya arenaria]
MASYKTLFQEKKNQNWLKASVAVDITRTGIIPFVTTIVTILYKDICANVERINGLPPGVTCNACTTPNVLKCGTKGVCGRLRFLPCKFHQTAMFRKCPANICNEFMLGIEGHHRFNGPSWKNTNASDWCSNPWEVAKCFLPPDGYLNVKTADDTDINGIINLIINCKFFDSYFTDDLSLLYNICTKVRDVGKKLRHSPSLMVTDVDLSNCMDALKTLLQDSMSLASNPSAQDALAKLILLENDQLSVSTDDLANVINNAISTTSEMLETGMNLQDKMNELKGLEQQIQALADEAVRRIARARNEDNHERYSSKSAALKQDLQKYYLESCSALDLRPLFDMLTPNLVEMYRPPHLSKSTVTKGHFDSGIGDNSKIVRSEIKEFDEVFLSMGEQAKHIYITAKAGVGKSTFCKFIVRLWCALQTNDTAEIESLKSRGAGMYLNACEELKNVQYVFYARLIQSKSRLCEMDDIVLHQVIKRLSKSEDYDMKFLQEILDKERCLMIFDGLDEWNHPDVKNNRCFEEDKESPHARSRDKCTVMITSRHWRLGLQKMHSKKSNICVEIDEMNTKNIRLLVKQAFTLLVGDSEHSRTIDDFFEMIDQKGLHYLFGSTLVALQLLSLWYEGHSLGDTKCHIYCDVLEMMLANALKRNPHLQQYVAEDHQQPDTIKCLQTRRHCVIYQDYIRNLGKMAFESLFNVKTLEAQIEENLSQSTRKTEELGLLTGLLTKTPLHSSVNPRYEYSFLHKTYQEMLACVYIASMPYNSEERERLVETIKSSSQTLSFDMMLFLCGMHGTFAQDMFEIYCDLQTAILCQLSEIEHSSVILFHENSLSVIREKKANNISCETGIKMRSLVLDKTYNNSSAMFTEDCGDISFLVLEMDEIENIDMFDRVQTIADFCETKLKFIYIENICDEEYFIPCPITPETINSCINLHTLVLSNLTFDGELDLSGCSSLSCLALSLPSKGDPVKLTISPNRLTKCVINAENPYCSPIVSIKCKCPFNSGLLQQLVLFDVKLEDNLRLLDCEQLLGLVLVNVDTRDITTSIDYSIVETCVLGGFTDPTGMKDALHSLQHSKCLKEFAIVSLNDSIRSCLNETLSSLENVEKIGFFMSESPLMDLHIPMSVRELEFDGILISADCLMSLINNCKAKQGEVQFFLSGCYVSPSDDVSIESIVGDIQQCNQCILNEVSILHEDEMEEGPVIGQMNVSELDFKINSDRQNE